MKKISKNQIWALLVTVFCVAITLILMVSAYNVGRQTGREETIQMIDEDLSVYTFTIEDKGGWRCGLMSHETTYTDPGELWDDAIRTEYNWDDGKLHLSYTHH